MEERRIGGKDGLSKRGRLGWREAEKDGRKVGGHAGWQAGRLKYINILQFNFKKKCIKPPFKLCLFS